MMITLENIDNFIFAYLYKAGFPDEEGKIYEPQRYESEVLREKQIDGMKLPIWLQKNHPNGILRDDLQIAFENQPDYIDGYCIQRNIMPEVVANVIEKIENKGNLHHASIDASSTLHRK